VDDDGEVGATFYTIGDRPTIEGVQLVDANFPKEKQEKQKRQKKE
jgi:hypothetical protein